MWLAAALPTIRTPRVLSHMNGVIMRARTRAVAYAISATLALSGAGAAAAAPAAPMPTQVLTDLFTVVMWDLPAADQRALCTALDVAPAKTAKALMSDFGSTTGIQKQLGVNAAGVRSGAIDGAKVACTTAPNATTEINAVSGLLSAIIGGLSKKDVRFFCVAYAQSPSALVKQFTPSFRDLPVSRANVRTGISAVLTSTCEP
jgi:hypothetical protein